MTQVSKLAHFSFAVAVLVLSASAVRAQVAPFQYWIPGGPFGFGGSAETQYFGEAPDEDGFRKGFSLRNFSAPVSGFGSGLTWAGAGAPGFNLSGLTADGAQYGYSFKGLGGTPVTLFGGVNTLRSNPDVFTSLVTAGFAGGNTLATSVQAGVEFKPTSNVSLSFSAGYVQPSAPVDTDLRSQMLSGQR
jgi:hypothetical protein